MKKFLYTVKLYIIWYKVYLQRIYPAIIDRIYFRLRDYDNSNYDKRALSFLIDEEIDRYYRQYKNLIGFNLDGLYRDVLNHVCGKYEYANSDEILARLCFKILESKKDIDQNDKERVSLFLKELNKRQAFLFSDEFPRREGRVRQ